MLGGGRAFAPWCQGFLIRLGLLEFADPRVFDNVKDEFHCFAFHSFVCGEIMESGLVDYLLAFSHRCLCIIRDRRIVDGRLWGEGKHGGVICHISCHILDETNEDVDPIVFVVRDDKKDLGYYLAELRKVGVRELVGDGIDFFGIFDEEGGDVVRHNCVHKGVDAVGCWHGGR